MEKELLFAQKLEQVRKTAKQQGNFIKEQQVREAFAELEMEEAQLQLVFDYLKQHKIGINEPADAEQYLSEQEKNYLQNYLEEIALLKPINKGEKEGITLSAMAGDTKAQSRLIELYLSDVAEIAKLYTGQGVSLEDLIGEGNVALTTGVSMLGCLENAEQAQGMLGKIIMDAMEEAIAENAANVKTDEKAVEKVNLVMEKAKELSQDLRRKVTPKELAEETEFSVDSIMEALRISGYAIEYIEVEEDA